MLQFGFGRCLSICDLFCGRKYLDHIFGRLQVEGQPNFATEQGHFGQRNPLPLAEPPAEPDRLRSQTKSRIAESSQRFKSGVRSRLPGRHPGRGPPSWRDVPAKPPKKREKMGKQCAFSPGGWVRDKLLGRVPNDVDLVVIGPMPSLPKRFSHVPALTAADFFFYIQKLLMLAQGWMPRRARSCIFWLRIPGEA